jgi:hypothetical protein|tara:strand:- start:125 stop:589 length:465 start_codon:yes stop_codon:yes gene_type:complete
VIYLLSFPLAVVWGQLIVSLFCLFLYLFLFFKQFQTEMYVLAPYNNSWQRTSVWSGDKIEVRKGKINNVQLPPIANNNFTTDWRCLETNVSVDRQAATNPIRAQPPMPPRPMMAAVSSAEQGSETKKDVDPVKVKDDGQEVDQVDSGGTAIYHL